MKVQRAELLTVFLEPEEGRRIKVGRLALKERAILFEYDGAFLQSGLEISPFHLPLRAGVAVGDSSKFDGLFGVFDDSLPDGWGRLLIDRAAAKAGISRASLSPLDRLALVGSRSMGALVYEPENSPEPPSVVRLKQIDEDAQAVLRNVDAIDLDRLIALGGSPQGARPKALIQLSDDGSLVYGDSRAKPGFTPYLVKFRASGDERHAGTLEHAYMKMAERAGITAATSVMLGKNNRHPGYFAVQRFDREGIKRLHLHTLAGLLSAPPRSTSLTYRDLLLATRQLTRNEAAVAEMFRRACFNVFAHNRDDHARNFAFLMNERGEWSPSPAYDLTFSDGPGGEHVLLVDNEGAHPARAHLAALATSVELKRSQRIIDEVEEAVSKFPSIADKVGLPRKQRDAVAKKLGVGRKKAR